MLEGVDFFLSVTYLPKCRRGKKSQLPSAKEINMTLTMSSRGFNIKSGKYQLSDGYCQHGNHDDDDGDDDELCLNNSGGRGEC